MSATPLPEALDRANNVLSKLEREAGPLVTKAATALLAVEQAAREVKLVETAIRNKRTTEEAASAVGLYQEAVRVFDKLSSYGAKKWVLRQQSEREVRVFADLMRWKARDHEHEDPNSPWHMVFDAYRHRQMDAEVDSVERYGTSMPQHVADAMLAKRIASRPPTFDLSVGLDDQNDLSDDAVENMEVVSEQLQQSASVVDLPIELSPPVNEETSAMPSAAGVAGAGEIMRPAAIPASPETLFSPGSFDEVALKIVERDGVDKALWTEVGFPHGSREYEDIARNGEAALDRGSATPHLAEFVAAAHQRYPYSFLGDLRKIRADRLAKVLAEDHNERARFRAQGFNVPGD